MQLAVVVIRYVPPLAKGKGTSVLLISGNSNEYGDFGGSLEIILFSNQQSVILRSVHLEPVCVMTGVPSGRLSTAFENRPEG